MLSEYEMTVIAKGDLPESDLNNLFAKYEKYMTADGGQILRKDIWGNRKLQFGIKKQYRGHYVNYDFVGASANLTEMERLMRIDDNVLRYLSIAIGKNVDIDTRRAELAKEAAAALARREYEDDRDDRPERGDRPDRGERDFRDRPDRGDRGDRDFRDRE